MSTHTIQDTAKRLGLEDPDTFVNDNPILAQGRGGGKTTRLLLETITYILNNCVPANISSSKPAVILAANHGLVEGLQSTADKYMSKLGLPTELLQVKPPNKAVLRGANHKHFLDPDISVELVQAFEG